MSRTITERCGCGASIVVEFVSTASALGAIDTWRENHRHDLGPEPGPEPDRPSLILEFPLTEPDEPAVTASVEPGPFPKFARFVNRTQSGYLTLDTSQPWTPVGILHQESDGRVWYRAV